jgi:hypothetical protein
MGMTIEDDVGIKSEDEARLLLLRAMDECGREAEVINLDPSLQGVAFGRVSGPFKYTGFPMVNSSVIMYTKGGAKKMAEVAADNMKRPYPRPIDHLYRPSSARYCYVAPTPFFQNRKAFVSELRRAESRYTSEVPIPDFLVHYTLLHPVKVVSAIIAVAIIVRYRRHVF